MLESQWLLFGTIHKATMKFLQDGAPVVFTNQVAPGMAVCNEFQVVFLAHVEMLEALFCYLRGSLRTAQASTRCIARCYIHHRINCLNHQAPIM
jgi:hypothetical protein